MRKIVGELDESLKRIYGSLRKRYNLAYDETLADVDLVLGDERYSKYPVILLSNNDDYSRNFISELNEAGEVLSYGFYRDGDFPYTNFTEVREMIPGLLEGEQDKFIYISIPERVALRKFFPGTICIRIGHTKDMMSIDIIKREKAVESEEIRLLKRNDAPYFQELLNKLYLEKSIKRPDLFKSKYKLSNTDILEFCKGGGKGAIVCIKEEVIVGFLIYVYERDADNDACNNDSILTIKDIYVEEDYRRQGIATRMYSALDDILRRSHSSKLKFKVWDDDCDVKQFIMSLGPKALYTLYELSF